MLEVRLPSPGGTGPSLWPPVALAVGTLLVVVPLAAIATQGLDLIDRIDALLLALAGIVIAGWGVLELSRGRRALLRHDTVVQLDGIGVTVRASDLAGLLTWPDLALVELSWWEIVPPYVDEPAHLPVLRFVPHHDGDVTLDGTAGLTADLAHSFGISVPAAVLTVVVGSEALGPLQQLADWLGEHRPEVPVEVGDPPDL